MKFIVDHNLPPQLVRVLVERFPGTTHTMDLGFDRLPDTQLWEFAKEHDFHLMTKDSDHFQLSLVRGAPPKVVWIRIGNAPIHMVTSLLERHLDDIETFLRNETSTLLALGR